MSEKRSNSESDVDFPNAKRVDTSGRGRGPHEVSFRCIVDSDDAGAIIGKGGSGIKHLRTLASSVLLPDSSGAPDRVLSIGAQAIDHVVEVLRLVLPNLCQSARGLPSAAPEFHPTLRMLIMQDQVGGVIGRGGDRISQLRQSTNTTIKVNPDPLPNSTERMTSITGAEADIIQCASKIMEFCLENPSSQHPQYFEPSANYQGYNYSANSRGGGFRGGRGRGRGGSRGGRGAYGRGGNMMSPDGGRGGGAFQGTGSPNVATGFGQHMGSPGPWMAQQGVAGSHPGFGVPAPLGVGGVGEPSVTEQVTIPDHLAGAIIGPRGSRVLKVREMSMCQIKIEEAKPDRSDRVITIIGTPNNVHYAQELLQENVRVHSNYQT